MVESCSGTLMANMKFFVVSGSESLWRSSFDSFMSLVNSDKGHMVRRLFIKANVTIGLNSSNKKVETFQNQTRRISTKL